MSHCVQPGDIQTKMHKRPGEAVNQLKCYGNLLNFCYLHLQDLSAHIEKINQRNIEENMMAESGRS